MSAATGSIEHFVDSLGARLVPPTYNYVTSQLAEIAEMERLIGAEQMVWVEQVQGRARPVMQGAEPPCDVDGNPLVKIDRTESDPAFTMHAPSKATHREGVNAAAFGNLQALIAITASSTIA